MGAEGGLADDSARPWPGSSGLPRAGITRVSSPFRRSPSPPPESSLVRWLTPGSSKSAAATTPAPGSPCRPASDAGDAVTP